jgi:preprotein translocase subunit SecY
MPFDGKTALYTIIIAIACILLTWMVVKLNEAARRITIHYAKRVQGNRTYGGVTTVLPVKLITAGVIPIIFAVAFLSVPSFAGQLMSGMKSVHLQHVGAFLTQWFQQPTKATFAAGGWEPFLYPAVYFLLVFVFTFFYTNVTFNAKDISENLQKQGGFIEGIRSGKQTEKYLSSLVNRVTLFGAFSLGVLALLPIIIQMFINASISLTGTSVLILVSVSLETLRSIESRALMVTYDQYNEPDFFEGSSDKVVPPKAKRRFGLGRRKAKENLMPDESIVSV